MPLLPVASIDDDDDEDDGPLVPVTQLQPVHELPVYGVRPADRKWVIDTITRELDAGQYVNAARQADAFLRDARILGAIEQRLAGLFGAPLELTPPEEFLEPRQPGVVADKSQAEVIRDEIKKSWSKMFPRASLEELLQCAIFNGIAIASKRWITTETPWKAVLEPIHAQFYIWRWDTMSYWVITKDEGLVNTAIDPRRWFVFTPYGYRRAYLRGRLRALLDPFMMRGWDKTDWANYNEIYGRPPRKAIMPQLSDTKKDKEFTDSIARMGGNTVIKTRMDADGNKYDVEFLEPGDSWKTFQAMLAWADAEITNVLLGQSMSTDGVGGLGSQEKPGEAVRADIKSADNQKLCEALYEQCLREYCELNYGNPDLAPMPNYQVAPPEDDHKNAQVDQAIAGALVAFKNAAAPINTRAFLEQRGYPLLTPEEEQAQKDEAMKRAQQMAKMQPKGPPVPPGKDARVNRPFDPSAMPMENGHPLEYDLRQRKRLKHEDLFNPDEEDREEELDEQEQEEVAPAPEPEPDSHPLLDLLLLEQLLPSPTEGGVKQRLVASPGACDKCASMDGEVRDDWEFPESPVHPNCTCTLEDVDEGEEG